MRALDDDTIVAVSTPPGEGGLGVVRLSGPQAIAVTDLIFKARDGKPLCEQKSQTVRYGHVVSKDSASSALVDEVLVLVMRAPRSYTREDVVEISAHGGTAVLQAIIGLTLKEGARIAAPGEFTKRAFLSGRMDLIQAEAVLDLIQAKTELGRRWATARLEGALSGRLTALKTELVGILAHLEASIDFPEDLLDTDPLVATGKRLEDCVLTVQALLKSADTGLLAKNGLKAVLAGRPNVGKSSLMNSLSRADRVIVTPHPGTTRDVVEEVLSIGGFPVRLLDTAGIQETDHPVEREGINRSHRAVADADVVLFILDGSRPFSKEDEAVFATLKGKRVIPVVSKADLPRSLDVAALERKTGIKPIFSSCVAKDGTKQLEDEIFRFVSGGDCELSDDVVVGSVRQKDLLRRLSGDLETAARACADGFSPEFVAVDVRAALARLGELLGEIVTEDVLEALFSRFCIGK
jgi:tRNA modification GTPase